MPLSTIFLPTGIKIGNHLPFVLIGGMNVLESRELALRTAETFCTLTEKLSIPYVFKASFDKANRSSVKSFRGPGLDQGLKWLEEVRKTFKVPIITDVHEPHQANAVASIVDIIQLPAFLSRQTDLVIALASTQKAINIKKAQFLSPSEMDNILQKFESAGNNQLMLCERGTMFGYNNLIVDILGFGLMKKLGAPVIFDATHALQLPGEQGSAAGGRRHQLRELALSGLATGIAGIFLEAHPNPSEAKCDGPSAWPLNKLEALLVQIKQQDELAKSLPSIEVE
ncbi:MAG TPA: 3-deoxy-8-phosphooctulonate synthase [Deltaproteobacteria bacterium]|nr:3-deoxy-8-phosphooctulonate synthase [Deltaproteobacteria bacterium]